MRSFPLIKFLFIFSVAISLGIYFELNQNIVGEHDISILKKYSRAKDHTIKASQLVTIGSNYDKTIKEDNLIHSVVDQGAFIKDFN